MKTSATLFVRSLLDLLKQFPDDASCRVHLEGIIWDGNPKCPHCSCNRNYRLKERGEFNGKYKCAQCKKKFTVLNGLMFEGSHVGLQKWFIAIYLFQSHKKGISSCQLAKDINVTQKSAWFMLHRIRHAMQESTQIKLAGRVELDETFVGGKNKNRHKEKKVKNSQGRAFIDKSPVMGMLQEAEKEIIIRPSKVNPLKNVKEKVYHKNAFVRCKLISDTTATSIQPIIRKYIQDSSVVISDEWMAYNGLSDKYDHRIVDHKAKQYVNERGDTSNALEGFWTWFKRAYVGTYHKMSRKHLQRYADEISFRYNHHRTSEGERFNIAISNTGKITYKQLIENQNHIN